MIDKLAAAIGAYLLKKFIEDIWPKLLPKLLALIPVVVAAIVKGIREQVGGMLPGLDAVGDPKRLVDQARETLNELIPDIDIPGLEFTDFWRPKT